MKNDKLKELRAVLDEALLSKVFDGRLWSNENFASANWPSTFEREVWDHVETLEGSNIHTVFDAIERRRGSCAFNAADRIRPKRIIVLNSQSLKFSELCERFGTEDFCESIELRKGFNVREFEHRGFRRNQCLLFISAGRLYNWLRQDDQLLSKISAHVVVWTERRDEIAKRQSIESLAQATHVSKLIYPQDRRLSEFPNRWAEWIESLTPVETDRMMLKLLALKEERTPWLHWLTLSPKP